MSNGHSQRWSREKIIQVVGFVVLLLTTHLFFKSQYRHFLNPNSVSRLYTVLAIVDDGTLSIDGPLGRYLDTQDKARFNGHFYSDKAPGLAVALAPVAWILRKAVIPLEDLRSMLTALRVLGLTLPIVAFWCCTLSYFTSLAQCRELAIAAVLSAALGSSFFIYSTILFSASAAGALLFLSFLALRKARRPRGRLWLVFAAGVLAGIGFSVDFVVMPAVAVLAASPLFHDRSDFKGSTAFALGVSVVLLAWMAHNYSIFDHPLRVGFHYHTDPNYRVLYRTGFMGIQLPSLEGLLGLSFSPARGLFFVSPALVFAFGGWLRLWRDRGHRADALCSSLVFASILLFASTTIEWQGGWSMGARYIVPAIPFLVVGVVGALRGLESSSPVLIAFAALSGLGIGSVALVAMSFSAFPYIFSNPVYNLTLPLIAGGFHAESILLPDALQRYAIPLYSLLAGGSALFVAWNTLSAHPRRLVMVPLACAIAATLMLGLARIPEDEERLSERQTATAWIIRQMGYEEESAQWLETRRKEEAAAHERGTRGP